MKAYLAVKYHEDHYNRDRIEGICAVLEKLGCKTFCATRDLEQWGTVALTPQELMIRSFEMIESCDIVVVDLTEKGVGVGIEAGYSCARGIPILTIAQTGSHISETLRGISSTVLTYEHFCDLEISLEGFGNQQVLSG